MAGYSGTPLWKKLGLKPGLTCCVLNPPDEYKFGLLAGSPEIRWVGPDSAAEFVHLFTTSRAELETTLPKLKPQIAPDGMIWVSWPKKASKVATDVSEDTIREVCLPLGLVDIKVCAVDEIWSGLKLVIRKELR